MTIAYLGLGSNVGDRRTHLAAGIEKLPDVVAVSPVYETDPVGGPSEQDLFLNLVAELDTDLSPEQLLGVCQSIEASRGRVRTQRWGPRTLDIDIIWMAGVEIDEANLRIPHPRWKQRRFVLAPLRELAPDLVTAEDIANSEGAVCVVEPLW